MARKIQVKTDNSGWVDPTKKKRKKRKPMTEKQRQAAAERCEPRTRQHLRGNRRLAALFWRRDERWSVWKQH